MKTEVDTHKSTSRREFLGVAGGSLLAVGSLANVAPRQAKAAPKKKGKIRLAVVGGGFGAHHHWHEHPNCEVTAVSDLVEDRRQKLIKAYKCERVFASLEEMLAKAADTFDAVAIFTGAPSHVKHAVMCMDAGKHVTSAVPAATNLGDCRRLKAAKEKTGLVYMMHESSCYRQPCIAARELYQAGAFGRLAYSEVEYYHAGIGTNGSSLSRWQGKESWRHGLPPLLYPTHALGLLMGVTKERIVKVSCFGQRVGEDFPEAKDNAWKNPYDNEIAIGLTNEGNICRFNGGWQLAAGGERGQWIGEKMAAYMPDCAGRPPALQRTHKPWKKWDVPEYWKTDRLPEAMRHPSGHGGSASFLSAEFVEALVDEREPSVDIYESLAMTVPGIVAHESALKGGVQLDVPQFDKA